MIRMCLITDFLSIPKNFKDPRFHIFRWKFANSIELSSYELVVLDQNVADDSFSHIDFRNLKVKIYDLLKTSGIVICQTYRTEINKHREFDTQYGIDSTGIAKFFPVNMITRYEISYDWLNEKSSYRLGLLNTSVGIVSKDGFTDPKEQVYREYFEGVDKCEKVIEGITPEEKPISIVKQSGKPVSAVIKESNGLILFIPRSRKKIPEICEDLYQIGIDLYSSFDREQILEEKRPNWITDYLCKREIEVNDRLLAIENEIVGLQNESFRFKQTSRLLFAVGKQLEDSVESVFNEFSFNYIRSLHNEPYDFILNDLFDSGKIYVEVTGENKITQKSRKMGQILAIQQIFNPNKDKILLITNCLRMVDPQQRDFDEMFSPQALTILKNTKIVIVQSKDLFNLWLEKENNSISLDVIKSKFLNLFARD